MAGLHAANVQGRDLDRLTRQLLVGQVVVQQAVQTVVDLLQVHLFVLHRGGRGGGGGSGGRDGRGGGERGGGGVGGGGGGRGG